MIFNFGEMIHYINFSVITERSIWQLVNCTKGLLGVNFFLSQVGSSYTVFLSIDIFIGAIIHRYFNHLWWGLGKVKPAVLLIEINVLEKVRTNSYIQYCFPHIKNKIMSKYTIKQLNHRGNHVKKQIQFLKKYKN